MYIILKQIDFIHLAYLLARRILGLEPLTNLTKPQFVNYVLMVCPKKVAFSPSSLSVLRTTVDPLRDWSSEYAHRQPLRSKNSFTCFLKRSVHFYVMMYIQDLCKHILHLYNVQLCTNVAMLLETNGCL